MTNWQGILSGGERISGTPVRSKSISYRGEHAKGISKAELRHQKIVAELLSQFRAILGPQFSQELLTIAQESDPKLFLSELLHLGTRLSQKNRIEAAFHLFNSVSQNSETLLGERDTDLEKKAIAERNAILGRGSLGLRLETLARNFVREATDPGMVGGMMVASPVFRAVRLGALSRLLGSPTKNFLTRGIGARLVASSVGFGAEVPSFLLTTKTIHEAMGHSQDWSLSTLWRETQSLGIGLFFLKSFGRLGQRGMAWAKGVNPLLMRHTGLFHQATMLAGINLGHHVQAELGFRPHTDGATHMVESLIFLMQINIGGNLSNRLTGPKLQQWMTALDLTSERMARNEGPERWDPSLVLVGVSGRGVELKDRLIITRPHQEEISKTFLMKGEPRVDLSEPENLTRELTQKLSRRYLVPETDEVIGNIAKRVVETPFSVREEEFRSNYIRLITMRRIHVGQSPDGGTVPGLEILDRATKVLRYVMGLEPFRRGTGTLYDSMAQVAFERTLEENRVHPFNELLRILAYRRSVESLEGFFLGSRWHYRYQIDCPFSHLVSRSHHWFKRLNAIGFPVNIRDSIGGYLATFIRGKDAKPFRDKEYNFLLLQKEGEVQERKSMQASYALRGLEKALRGKRGMDSRRQLFVDAVERAMLSPVPLLFYDRLFKIVATGGLSAKIVELSRLDHYNEDYLQTVVRGDRDPGYANAIQRLDGTVYTGYVRDSELAKKFVYFYHLLPYILHEQAVERHRSEYFVYAEDTLGERENFGAEEVLKLLFHRPTPLASEAYRSIKDGEVDLVVHSKESFAELIEKHAPEISDSSKQRGIYLLPEESPTGKPYIGILEMDPSLSREEKIAMSVQLAAIAIHEFEHYKHIGENTSWNQENVLVSEMKAWLEENLYLLQQGEKIVWDRAKLLAPDGFGIYLRGLIDYHYIDGPRDIVLMPRTKDWRPRWSPL